MKRSFLALSLAAALLLGVLAGCGPAEEEHPIKAQDNIPFTEEQYYAVAYLGYQQIEDLADYAQAYLDSDQLPVHYLSGGDYYLVIPRYSGMALSLYRNEIDGTEPVLVFEDPDCGPFILQCNASDIFADATIRLEYQGQTVEFSPFISLKDGTVEVGPNGLLLDKSQEGAN